MSKLELYISMTKYRKEENANKYLEEVTKYLNEVDSSGLIYNLVSKKHIEVSSKDTSKIMYITVDKSVDQMKILSDEKKFQKTYIIKDNLSHLDIVIDYLGDSYADSLYNPHKEVLDIDDMSDVLKELAKKYKTNSFTLSLIIKNHVTNHMNLKEDEINDYMLKVINDSELLDELIKDTFVFKNFLSDKKLDNLIISKTKTHGNKYQTYLKYFLRYVNSAGNASEDFVVELNIDTDMRDLNSDLVSVNIVHNYFDNYKLNNNQLIMNESKFYQEWKLKLNKVIEQDLSKSDSNKVEEISKLVEELANYMYDVKSAESLEQISISNMITLFKNTDISNIVIKYLGDENKFNIESAYDSSVFMELEIVKENKVTYAIFDYLGYKFYSPIDRYKNIFSVETFLWNVGYINEINDISTPVRKQWLKINIGLFEKGIIEVSEKSDVINGHKVYPLRLIQEMNNFIIRFNSFKIEVDTDGYRNKSFVVEVNHAIRKEYDLLNDYDSYMEDINELHKLSQ